MNEANAKWLISFGYITQKAIDFNPKFAEIQNFNEILKSLGYSHCLMPHIKESEFPYQGTFNLFIKANSNNEIIGFTFDSKSRKYFNILSFDTMQEKTISKETTYINYGFIEPGKIPVGTSLADIEKAVNDVASGLVKGEYKWE